MLARFSIPQISGEAAVSPCLFIKNRIRHTGFPLSSLKLARTEVITCSGIRPRVTKGNVGKREHHLWKKRDSAGSGQKALHLARILSDLSNDKEEVFGALDKWCAWETEFPVIAASKALGILRKRNQWLQIIQVAKWLLSKGQCMTLGTYDILMLAFDMTGRIDEAEVIWNMILQTYTRSVSKRLFARMISLYDHHQMTEKMLEVFADMEELGVKPDEDTVRKVGKAFQILGQEDKKEMVIRRYGLKYKYIHFNGERVRVKMSTSADRQFSGIPDH